MIGNAHHGSDQVIEETDRFFVPAAPVVESRCDGLLEQIFVVLSPGLSSEARHAPAGILEQPASFLIGKGINRGVNLIVTGGFIFRNSSGGVFRRFHSFISSLMVPPI